MDINTRDNIARWTNLTNEITEQWIRDYFEIEEDEEISFYWVANDIGTIFEFADYFFDFNTVLKCYELGISRQQLFQWYDSCLSNHPVHISLAKFILSPEDKKKVEEKEFKKALEQYETKET